MGTTTDELGPGTRARRREWLGLAVLALPTLLLALDLSVLYLALPHVSADLGAGATQQLWITDIYGFMIAGFLVTMGTLGDRIGRRRLLMIGAAAFGVASVLAAYATTTEMLIVMRGLLGVAGATLMPSTLALISNMFRDPGQRASAIAVWMSCFMGGTAIGPLVGGFFLERFWWGSVFLMGVPVMLLLLLAAPVLLPEFRDRAAGRLDLVSVVLLLAAVLPVVYGLKELAQGAAAPPLLALAAGTGLGVAFVRRQRRLADPLMDLRLFSNVGFRTALVVNFSGALIMGGMFFFVTLHLQMVAGLSPLRAGLWLVPGTVVMIAASMAVPALARRVGTGRAVGLGFAVGAVGLGLLTQVGAPGGLLVVIGGHMVAAAGVAPTGVLATDLIVGSVPRQKAGAASSMSETSGELGLALGIAVFGSLGAAVYRFRMTDVTLPGLRAEGEARARDSIAGAVAEAAGRTDASGALTVAQESFTSAVHVVAASGGVLMVLMAVLVVRVLRHRRPGAAGPDPVAAPAPSAPV